MATYESYKTIKTEQFIDGTVTNEKLGPSARHRYCVKWVTGNHCRCSPGCCCLWTVPGCTRRVYWEMWGAGGNGTGACSCNRCHHYHGAGGGYFNTKMIDTVPGCQYTVCAGGVYRCLSRECTGLANGCTTYVNGYNLSNFCAIGGHYALANTDWTNYCLSCWTCCLSPGNNGGDFGFGNHVGMFGGIFNCHCHHQYTRPTPAPFLGGTVAHALAVCWIRCGCWIAPPGHGGQNAQSTYCGSSCCGQGGTGGPGAVKITFT